VELVALDEGAVDIAEKSLNHGGEMRVRGAAYVCKVQARLFRFIGASGC
jgi:hypothetical protein